MRSIIFCVVILICLCTTAFAAYSVPSSIVSSNLSKNVMTKIEKFSSASVNYQIYRATTIMKNTTNVTNKTIVSIVPVLDITPIVQQNNSTFVPAGGAAIASGTTIGSVSAITAAHCLATDAYACSNDSRNSFSRSVIVSIPKKSLAITVSATSLGRVTKGPMFPEALQDGDNDSVINMADECPNTPEGEPVFENGCRCKDSEAGWDKYYKGTIEYSEKVLKLNLGTGSSDKNKTGVQYSITNYFAEDSCSYTGSTSFVDEKYCYAAFETGASENAIGTLSIPCGFGCSNGKCKKTLACATEGAGTCSDGTQNQDETGIDCGGKCAPCNTHCTSGVKFAPSDTPCTTYYNTDPHRVDYTWTDGELEYTCRWYEVCHPDLDFVIEEAQDCCSVTTPEELSLMPDLNLCKEALKLGGNNCKKCTGMYIIKGMGTYARWMKGYQELDTLYTNPTPTAERLINDYKIGVCRDYSLATATLLRKAGYSQDDIGNTCDGAHCYNVVRFPGDAKWHVVDTTGNSFDVNPGGLPQSGYEYCKNLNETRWCFWINSTTPGYHTNTIPDVDEYWSIIDGGGTYSYPHATMCYPTTRNFEPMCGPGVACGKDSYRIPDFAPSIKDIIGCS